MPHNSSVALCKTQPVFAGSRCKQGQTVSESLKIPLLNLRQRRKRGSNPRRVASVQLARNALNFHEQKIKQRDAAASRRQLSARSALRRLRKSNRATASRRSWLAIRLDNSRARQSPKKFRPCSSLRQVATFRDKLDRFLMSATSRAERAANSARQAREEPRSLLLA